MDAEGYELHPGYGAVPRNGDFVECGDVLGMSVDAKQVVTARASGRVIIRRLAAAASRQLILEITPANHPEAVVEA